MKVVFTISTAILIIALYLFIHAKHKDACTLEVYSYSSFAASWGAGPLVKSDLEKHINCKVEILDAGDAGLLLQKMKIEKPNVDVVIGIDPLHIEEAKKEFQWLDLGEQPRNSHIPATSYQTQFHIFDWAPMSIIYRKSDWPKAPSTFDELLSTKTKWSIQDPRTSTPGLQFWSWLISMGGVDGAKKMYAQILATSPLVSPSWSSAYGLFKKKQSQVVFSYITSPLYHEIEEKNLDYAAMKFLDGLPYQVEYVAVPNTCKHCEAAKIAVRWLTQNLETQKIVMQKNYMLPALEVAANGTPFQITDYKLLSNFSETQTKWTKQTLIELYNESTK